MKRSFGVPGGSVSFSFGELTGAVGDAITTLPIIVALALMTDISLAHVLIVFGLFQVVWGFWYGYPVSVEPMKALAALAIAGTINYGELALAGLVLGVLLLGIGLTRTLGKMRRWIGQPVIRGVQFAVGLLLLETGLDLTVTDPFFALIGIAIILFLGFLGYMNLTAISILAVGLIVALFVTGLPFPQLPGLPPTPPLEGSLTWEMTEGVFAQFAMTIGNAALATSLMLQDFYKTNISPDQLSSSMGTMNLVGIPLGGIPMCHGCDGVAGKHEFGAETGGNNIIIGFFYIATAFFVTTALLQAFPLAILGVLLLIIAYTLGKNLLKSNDLRISILIGVLTVMTNLGIAFIVGIITHLSLRRIRG
ncbi:putative sulfate/molybdate transporter [Methanonatronarchaeum sp. AMET6-2]|uniref:putative sulfate/molybdate transporter n=1 Tax=Methanonatronarchaeum sp. AMET6-2 TaxID=2933293 RepID=UPI001229AA9F|nr:putative sulfate/molybdate transporter [Methanonatronarchaeum sp. AMET6-2]RZN60475.1 MAG: sulfate transporter [Methanonatronarchaeia archaeon]UOY09918.1 putative sulfate/molybdate transporter [Methanonatronarchaeum sp. AMET6-2]